MRHNNLGLAPSLLLAVLVPTPVHAFLVGNKLPPRIRPRNSILHPHDRRQLPPPTTGGLKYKIIGGLEEEDEDKSNENAATSGDNTSRETHNVFLRHFDSTLKLMQQSKENDGSVSQAGTPWEASTVLADFITHPQSGITWAGQTCLELGAGIGLCSICASVMGANVIATDAATTSLNLIRENTALYPLERPVAVLPLLWGDYESMSGLPKIDILMASDVVYFRSNTEGLKKTIEALCGPTTLVIIAHTFRTEPDKDMEFFESLVNDYLLQREEVQEWLLPQGYNQRRIEDGRLPVTIFMFRRRQY